MDVVATRTPYGRTRTGTCSAYLAALREGDVVCGVVQRGSFSAPVNQGLVLVGTGTGVAPLRAILHERHALLTPRTSPATSSSGAMEAIDGGLCDGLQKHVQNQALERERGVRGHGGEGDRSSISTSSSSSSSSLPLVVAREEEREGPQREVQGGGEGGGEVEGEGGGGSIERQSQCLFFFGCRKRNADHLYGAEWDHYYSETGGKEGLGGPGESGRGVHGDAWASLLEDEDVRVGPVSTAVTAFSREQDHKLYVTDKIRRHGAAVWATLSRAGAVFVCGSAKRMPMDVRNALKDVVVAHGHMEGGDAEKFLKGLEKSGRFVVEAWG